MISSPAGNDLLFDEGALEQGRNFNNKLWNALKLVKTIWKVADAENAIPGFYNAGELPQTTNWIPQPENAKFAIDWFRNKLAKTKKEVNDLHEDFKLSEALKIIYSLIWDDFCSWYLEWIKPDFGQPIDFESFSATIEFFEDLTQLLHPYMPFVTEEIYHLLKIRAEGDDLCIKQYQNNKDSINESLLNLGELAKQGIGAIRDLRGKLGLKNKELVYPQIKTDNPDKYLLIEPIITRMTSSGSLGYITESIPQVIGATSGSDIIYLPFSTTTTTSTTLARIQEQKEKLKEELEHYKQFLSAIENKLNNVRFVQNARPEVVDNERRKKEDTESKIKALEESLAKTI
jgi:valyl-tRNA synthetase